MYCSSIYIRRSYSLLLSFNDHFKSSFAHIGRTRACPLAGRVWDVRYAVTPSRTTAAPAARRAAASAFARRDGVVVLAEAVVVAVVGEIEPRAVRLVLLARQKHL